MSTFHCCSGEFTLEARFYLSLQFGSFPLFSSENNGIFCHVRHLWIKTGQTTLLEYKYSEIFVLVFGVIFILLSKVG